MPSDSGPFFASSSCYTVESVLKGHPDKVCDQICDALLDEYMRIDHESRVAIECMGKSKTLVISGEVASSAEVDVELVSNSVYQEIGYHDCLNVTNVIGRQSEQLAGPVSRGAAGDQGVMYGFACAGPYNSLPLGLHVVHTLAKEIDALREREHAYLPDGKVQVTVKNSVVQSLVISVQHHSDSDLHWLRKYVMDQAAANVVDIKDIEQVYFNHQSQFVLGGFANDTGLSGRKLCVDSYGGLAPQGGGSFSGKDPSKVDRSAAYMARFVAKSVVANGLASSCLIAVAYVFGEAQPIMLEIDLDGNAGTLVANMIRRRFDFRPEAIIERLRLKEMRYLPTATYGHFSNPDYPWEEVISL